MLLSLCIPTNGISEWVFSTLESIYNQNIDDDKFEVIVTDNGDNYDFECKMRDFALEHHNLIYKKTNAYMFYNQIEALKLASGDFLKFVNHRSIIYDGRLKYMYDFIEEHMDEKPVIYFSNGTLGWGPKFREFESFDEFVCNLGVMATWTSGVGIWREDYIKIPENYQYDSISPHAGILYSERKKKKYIINEFYWMNEIETDHSRKGKYDLFKAFALDEFIITINLYRDGDISFDTLLKVKESFRLFLISLYCDFVLKKIPCSYELGGFDKYIGVFFDKEDIVSSANGIRQENT